MMRPAVLLAVVLAAGAALGVTEVAAAAGGDGARPLSANLAFPGLITLKVDVTDVERRVFTVHESLTLGPDAARPVPVASQGPRDLTLLYPEWLPGDHAPRGPIEGLAGLTASAAGRPVSWRRDPLDVYAFHFEVPADATRLDLTFQFVTPLTSEQGRAMVTPEIVGLQWNTVVLYPAGYYATQIPVVAQVTLPDAWGFATALEVESRRGGTVQLGRTSLDVLVDSPLLAGRYFRRIDLTPGQGGAPVHLDVAADIPAALDATPQQVAAHRKLVAEAYALFGSRHFDHYEMLLALSNSFGEIGLEHHRSSENRRGPAYFYDWEHGAVGRDLLPHELTHSWNGKFRMPAGLATPNFNVPMQDSLLWVYEGLTNYWGYVLAARSGLWTPELGREAFAYLAATMDRDRPGRAWRDLEDTTTQPIITARRPLSWPSWQRSEDYYLDGQLVWLDVDTRLRELTGERRSLDDFAHAFFGGGDGQMGPVPYGLEDVVRALNSVAPANWAQFLEQRVHGTTTPLDGLARGGWRLVYGDTRTEYLRALEQWRGVSDFIFSIGLAVGQTGEVQEVRWGSPAYQAGLTIGTLLVAVNGHEYHADWLREAITEAHTAHTSIELIVKNLDRYRVLKVPYYDGLKYPHLERIAGSIDRLTAIEQPRTH